MKTTSHLRHLSYVLLSVVLGAASVNAADTGYPGTTPAPAADGASVMELKPGPWVVMGSSSAAGAGAPPGKGWVALMADTFEHQGVHIVNLARGGAVTYRGMRRNGVRVPRRPSPDRKTNIDAALAYDPALLIVSYPTNDTALGYSVDETVNNLLTMRAQAEAAGAAVIMLSTQPRNLDPDRLAQLSEIDDRLSASMGPCFVEVRKALAGSNGKLAPRFDWGDGIHPSRAGHALIAKHIVELIRSGRCVRLATD